MDARARLRLVGALSVPLLVVSAVLATDVGSARMREVLSDTSLILASTPTTAATAWAAARSTGRLRRAWLLLTGATAAWTLGNATWFYDHVITLPTSYPAWSDLFYLLAPPLAVAGLLTFPGRLGWGGRYRVLLDGSLIAVSLLYVSWDLVLSEAFQVSGYGPLARTVFLAYPLADVVVCTFAILLATRARPGARQHIFLVATGFAIYSLADSVYAWQSLRGEFQMGSPIDLGWIAGPLLIGLGALAPSATARSGASAEDQKEEASSRTIFVGTLVTFVSLFLAVIVNEASDLASGRASNLGSALLLLVAGLFLIRLVTAVRETRSLQDRVRERTAELTRALRRQELTLMAVADGILGVDVDAHIVLANDAALRLLGTSADDLIGQDVHDVLHAHGASEPPCDRASCPLAAGLDRHTMLASASDRFTRQDGTSFPVEFAVTTITDDAQHRGAVVVFRDVTERREVDRMKDEFISVVSHELRTPLTSIRGSLGLVASGMLGELPERGRRMVDIAVDNTDRLIRLINDILDIERIKSGTAVLQKAECEVASVVAQTMRLMLPVARDAGVDIGLAKVEGRIWADEDRIVQTLTNLLSNAIKFSAANAAVTVAARRDGANILFTVADLGRGIPADKLESVFGRFQQVDASDSREKGGTGLGLAICRSIVEQHGGRIWADSVEGAGATFSFTIPAARDASETMGTTRFEPEGDGPLVLICDDDRSLLEVVSTFLSTNGYRALVAQSGEQAISLAETEQPAAIVLDLFMPGMDGWKTVHALKARPSTSAIPILVLSVLESDQGAGLGDLVESWVTKPVMNPNHLIHAIEQLIHGEGHTPRVLIVEDDIDLADILVTSFERHGLRAVSATSAEAAIRLSRTFLPDLIILDLVLPDGDGFAVVEQLRQDGRLSSVPLVVYTARDLSEQDRRRLTLGETTVFFKSTVSPEVFEGKVMALLDRVTGTARGASNVLA